MIAQLARLMPSLKSTLATFISLALALGFAAPAEAARNTGAINFSGTEYTEGLNEVARFVGKYQASTDADGYDSSGNISLDIVRPDGATSVRAAYLTSLSSLDDGNYDPPVTTLDGDSVSYSYRSDYNGYANHMADVTSTVSDFLSGATVVNANYTSPFSGETTTDLFTIAAELETSSGLSPGVSGTQYQGLMLTVIFEDPTQSFDSTVIVMFGNATSSPEQETKFSFSELTQSPSDPSWMAVGIGWSWNGTGEVSTIEASTNTQARPDCTASPSSNGCITKTAGGFDDGSGSPQQLITYGGVGDSRANGFGTVTQSTDDELYNLDDLLTTGTSEITLYSSNTSNNDNFGMLTVFLPVVSNPEITFDANGGTGTMAIQASSSSAAINKNTFERTGYEFASWEDSSGNNYVDEATYSFAASTTLTAQWRAIVSANIAQVAISPNSDVAVDATVTGPSLASDSARIYEVSLATTVGTLTLSDATLADCDGDGNLAEAATGVYCSPGKLDVTEVTELKFRSDTTDSLNTVLDAVTFNIADQSTADLTLSISEVGSSQDVYSFGGRYYEYVASTNISPTAAETAAEARSFFGLSGYLANITSEAENEFVANEAQANNIWFGASDRDSEGNWSWLGGPEEGEIFFKVGDPGYNADYFSSWASGEPNNSFGPDDEHYAVTNWGTNPSTYGEWNDLDVEGANHFGVNGYLVEYGDDTEVSTLGSASASTTLSLNTTPTPYTGPVITDVNEITNPLVTHGETATVNGSRLSGVTKAIIDGKEVEILSVSYNSFQIVIPDGISPGTYDLQIESSLGNLTYLDAMTVAGAISSEASTCVDEPMSWWTTRISSSEAKVYIKCPELDRKLRILIQYGGSGEYEVTYVKTLRSDDDPSLIVNSFGTYIVRTIELEEINRVRIRIDDEEVLKVRYNNYPGTTFEPSSVNLLGSMWGRIVRLFSE